ncbi:MAG: long-chain fatty acid--CoA ligase [Burkholderiales bacterium]|nr:long-chain fatty acid--CoA ligase [Burkholderiales bacterium]
MPRPKRGGDDLAPIDQTREPRHYVHWPPGLPRNLPFPHTSVFDNLRVSATRYPDKALALFYDSPLTYGRALREAQALAGYLQQHCGIRRGDRVLLFMQNSPQFIIGFYAILRADAMVVPVNPMNLTEELRHYVEDSDARVALCGQELYAQLRPLLGHGLDHVVVATYGEYVTQPTDLNLPDSVCATREPLEDNGAVAWADALQAGLQPGPHQAGPDDLCVMPYTSGTTGRPKGCIHTHATVMSTIVIMTHWGGSHQDARVLCTLPLFHVTGMQGSMNAPIYSGATVVLMTRWDRRTALQLIERHRVDNWTNISTMAIDFLANPELARHDLSSLRRIGGGGAAMPEAVARRLKALTGLDYIEGYGLSETIAPTHINPDHRPKKQCLGIPVCNTAACVIDPDTLRVLGPDATGEIVCSGPQIFKGYWKNPQATRDCFIELEGRRFFRTGDLGRYDEDGYFFIVDRVKRMINASGYKVWPAEVEAIMYGHPEVQEACVIGKHDAHRGETVKALVVLKAESRGKVSPEEIIGWCRSHMAAYKIPRVVEFVDALPKTATGKIQGRVLQEQENARTDCME